MKFWLLPMFLILATSCSHSAATSDTSTKSETPVAAKTPPAPVVADAGKAKVKTKAGSHKRASDAKAADADKSEAPMGDHTTCKSGGDERLLEIVTKGTGCTVEYTKLSQKKEIASAEHEAGHCKQVAQKVREHLEASGFTCN